MNRFEQKQNVLERLRETRSMIIAYGWTTSIDQQALLMDLMTAVTLLGGEDESPEAPKLKKRNPVPCLCGTQPEVRELAKDGGDGTRWREYTVRCPCCSRATTTFPHPAHRDLASAYQTAREDAVAEWNSFSAPKQIPDKFPALWDCIQVGEKRGWVVGLDDPQDPRTAMLAMPDGTMQGYEYIKAALGGSLTIGPRITDAEKAMAWCRGEYDPEKGLQYASAEEAHRAAGRPPPETPADMPWNKKPERRFPMVNVKELRGYLANAVKSIRGDDLMQCIGDGYHTFDELYEHRMTLFVAFLAAINTDTFPGSHPWWTRHHHPDDAVPMFEGFVLAGAELEGEMVTYHLRESYISLLDQAGIPERGHAPPFDGHTADDVLDRLRRWITR